MKPSKYNYYIPDGDKVIIFNGITEQFFEVSGKNSDRFREVVENPGTYEGQYDDFLQKLEEGGFIIPDDRDEWEGVMEKYTSQRHNSQYYLMILPTYQCNVRCWYCTQDHESVWMSDEIFSRLRKHINLMLENPEIKQLHLSWFGGEPLLAYDKLLDFTNYAKALCQEKNVKFTCHITTNGLLLNPQRIDALTEAGLGVYQITIDGDKKIHDTIKIIPGGSAYEKVLANIVRIAEKGGRITLRFNYTKDNLDPDSIIADLKAHIPENVRDKIHFTLFKVWQEDAAAIDRKEVINLYAQAQEAGIRPRLSRGGMCYADQRYYNCVFPNGRVGKCDNHNMHTLPGELLPDGEISWPPEGLGYHTPVAVAGESECTGCRYFPVCWGPCVSSRRAKGGISCIYDDKESAMAENVKNIVLNTKSCYQN